MKALFGLIAVCFAVDALALGSLPNGSWAGMGKYTHQNGTKGAYDEQLTIQSNVMTVTLAVDGKSSSCGMAFTFLPNDFVTVAITDKATGKITQGKGYCATEWCHVTQGTDFEITVVFVDNQVYELGSFTENGQTAFFESALKPASPPL